jgi:hypothetical protein
MDPYLESPNIWPDVHAKLISEIQTALSPALRPEYVVRVELRVYITDEDDPARHVIVPDLRIEEKPFDTCEGSQACERGGDYSRRAGNHSLRDRP